MLTRLINHLYWKYYGNITLSGRINGSDILMCYHKGEIGRLYVWPWGKVENFHIWGEYVTPKRFNEILALQKL